MSRRSRKRFEKILTRRAKTGFPPVSKAILHRNGTVTSRGDAGAVIKSKKRTVGQLFAGTDEIGIVTPIEHIKQVLPRRASWLERVYKWLQRWW
jgi:hypothetical protein